MHRRSCGSLRRRIFRHGASTWNVLVAVVRSLKKAFASVDAIKHENRRTFVCAILWPRQLSIALFGTFIWLDGEVGNAVGSGKAQLFNRLPIRL